MTVDELIKKLQRYNSLAKVSITDGYRGITYEGDFKVAAVRVSDEEYVVDIGIGGCEIK